MRIFGVGVERGGRTLLADNARPISQFRAVMLLALPVTSTPHEDLPEVEGPWAPDTQTENLVREILTLGLMELRFKDSTSPKFYNHCETSKERGLPPIMQREVGWLRSYFYHKQRREIFSVVLLNEGSPHSHLSSHYRMFVKQRQFAEATFSPRLVQGFTELTVTDVVPEPLELRDFYLGAQSSVAGQVT